MTRTEVTRTCGSCHECCVHVPVAAFNKPSGVPCHHLNVIQECGACGIYADRPSECAVYRCSWLEGHLPDAMKPDASAILLETMSVEWPKPLTILMGFEREAGDVVRNIEALSQDVEGVIIAIVQADQTMVMFGRDEDIDAFDMFVDNARRVGSVTHHMADGTFEQKI